MHPPYEIRRSISMECDPRAQRVAIHSAVAFDKRFDPRRAARLVEKPSRRTVIVARDNINPPVVSQVAEGRAARHFGMFEGVSCEGGYICEFFIIVSN